MLQAKKILTPTDFSKTAEHASRRAVQIAEAAGAELVFVHVLRENDQATRQMRRHTSFSDLAKILRKGAERELTEWQTRLVDDRVPSKCVIRAGTPSLEIAECAKEEAADLIVIGDHGYGALRKFLLGSTAERVLRIAPCSVLLVREGDDENAPR